MPDLDDFAAPTLSRLPGEILTAVQQAAMPSLSSGPANNAVATALSRELQWGEVTETSQRLCESGLWLLAGDLDRSHSISQQLDSRDGSFWHGIMHRREGDFGNSKYWFRRVGDHPVLEEIADRCGGIYDDPFDFIDRCSRSVGTDSEEENQCQAAQWAEWQALMVWSLDQ